MSNIIIQTLNTSGMNTLRENDLFLFDVAKACLTHPKIRINNIMQIYVKKKTCREVYSIEKIMTVQCTI